MLVRGDELYLEAFDVLSTERSFGNGVGPIPWSKIIFYGERKGLTYDMIEVFDYVIRAMDRAFLQWHADQQEKPK